MTDTHAARLYDLIVEVRKCFRALANLGDALHSDVAVTSAMRAILEHLAGEGAQTVPRIAAAKSVSRQSVQQTVDGLVAEGLLEARPNPAHKRSALIALTPRGAEVFATMREREADVLSALAPFFPPGELADAITTLSRLTARVRDLEITSEGD